MIRLNPTIHKLFTMRRKISNRAFPWLAVWLTFASVVATEAQSVPIPERWDYKISVDDRLDVIPGLPKGPFVRLSKTKILSASSPSGTDVMISDDNGKNWKAVPVFKDASKYKLGSTAAACTDNGVVVLAFFNLAERHWTWSDELQDAPGAELPTYVVRSLDRGKTWEEPVLMHREWTGMNTHMIITKKGNIVFTSMMMLHNPGRHSVLTYMSEDDGKTWHRSNIIDMGGAGTHGGVTETTIEELSDGRLLGLMRTNWMQLWRIESWDQGKTWHPMGPSGIPASSSHARLLRLASGRLLLVWNRPYPEGETSYRLVGGDNIWSAVPVSNYRSQLSIAFSEDDGKTWSKPVVIAKTEDQGFRRASAGGVSKYMPQKEVAYPFAFEFKPGVVWVTTGRGPLRAKFEEADFVK